jgi:general stress protein 26
MYSLLKEFDTALLVTTTTDKKLRARPMAIQNPDEVPDCDLWFVTADNTAKADEIYREQEVCVCAYRARDQAYLSISASAHVVKNPVEIKKLWKPAWKAWFPDGEYDPMIALLKLKVERAEYWEPAGGQVRVLYEMIRSALTGESASAAQPKHI